MVLRFFFYFIVKTFTAKGNVIPYSFIAGVENSVNLVSKIKFFNGCDYNYFKYLG